MSEAASPPRETLIRARSVIEFRAATEEDDLGEGYLGLLRILFSPVNEWTEINSMWEGRFMERFAPGAWKKTIREQANKVRSLFQHGADPVVGDKPLGPIRTLAETDEGGYGEVALLDTSYNRDLLPGLQEGLYGASHRFSVMREEEVSDPEPSDYNPHGLKERTVKEAQLFEFGPVTFPAYAGATAGMRSMTDDFLMRCFERNPDRLREMFEQATDLADRQIKNQEALLELHRSTPEILSAVVDAVNGGIGGKVGLEKADDAPSETDAAQTRTSETERRVPTPRKGVTYTLNQKEEPRWRLP